MRNKAKSIGKNQKYAIVRPIKYETTKVFSMFVETYLRYTFFSFSFTDALSVNTLFEFHLRDLEKRHV